MQLHDLPLDVLNYMERFLEVKNLANITKTCTFFHKHYKRDLYSLKINNYYLNKLDQIENNLSKVEMNNQAIAAGKLHPAKTDHLHYVLYTKIPNVLKKIIYLSKIISLIGLKVDDEMVAKIQAIGEKFNRAFSGAISLDLTAINDEVNKKINKLKYAPDLLAIQLAIFDKKANVYYEYKSLAEKITRIFNSPLYVGTFLNSKEVTTKKLQAELDTILNDLSGDQDKRAAILTKLQDWVEKIALPNNIKKYFKGLIESESDHTKQLEAPTLNYR